MKMSLTGEIKKLLDKKYKSRHYELSTLFIKKKLDLKISQYKMSQLMGLSLNNYLEMEFGSTEIPVKDYEEALKNLENNINQ
jgi:hypothetical protein